MSAEVWVIFYLFFYFLFNIQTVLFVCGRW